MKLRSRTHHRIGMILCVSILFISGCQRPPSEGETSGDGTDHAAETSDGEEQSSSESSADPSSDSAEKSPEEIVAAFQELPPPERTAQQLAEVSELSEGQETIVALDLTSGLLGDVDLQPISKLSNLRSLNLTKVPISGAGLNALAGLDQLEELILDSTQVGDDVGDVLKQMKSLKVLSLRQTGISDQVFTSLAKIPQLEVLHLDGNKVLRGKDFAIFVEQGSFQSLKELTAADSQLGFYGFRTADRLTNLEVLKISNSGVHDGALEPISGCQKLRELDLSSNNIGDAGIVPLKKLKALESLKLAGCQSVTNDALVTIRTMKQLKLLDLTGTDCSRAALELAANEHLPNTEIVGVTVSESEGTTTQ
ncbi:leucine-rich repeat domain-containing protein [Thalassoglobus neptunius]|uniref:leucine-rich repeat domain-containing protein n=1 Tax=Thalassoglobus neptunius TaxID=1938619 RepID=UPI0018D234BA|nr:hypothetical protein [Thalassoglobus neptunius]